MVVFAASAWLSVCLLESFFSEDCCWVVLVSGEVMAGVVVHKKKW